MPDGRVRRCRPLLGTYVEITVPEPSSGAVDGAYAAIAHVHARMSFHDEGSDLARLRQAPPETPVPLDPQTIDVLRLAHRLYLETDGLFDVAVGSRLVEWGFLPEPAGYAAQSWDGTVLDLAFGEDGRVIAARPLLIDLGGIAKGYAVDRAVDHLVAQGVPAGIVNAGGDLRVFGEWDEPVHLREADGSISAAISLHEAALASSSNLLDRRRHRGRQTSPHVAAGVPVLAGEAVTVIADLCMVADAMTKVALASPALAERLLGNLGGEILSRSPAGTAH